MKKLICLMYGYSNSPSNICYCIGKICREKKCPRRKLTKMNGGWCIYATQGRKNIIGSI